MSKVMVGVRQAPIIHCLVTLSRYHAKTPKSSESPDAEALSGWSETQRRGECRSRISV